ncbi:asparagine synthase (glutamine-hydrolyzing) [Porticoccus sp. GXU_MW_L64]
MCGINGFVSKASIAKRKEEVLGGLKNIRHRGPDDLGVEVLGQAVLGQVRLSILDLSDAGHQPMYSACRRYVIVYNGEVYNYKELVTKYNISTKSQTDTEVVLELFAKFGDRSFEMLNGMFAFSVYDLKDQVVWLVRDRIGIKPLYIVEEDEGLAFSSEIKGLPVGDEILSGVNSKAISEWCYYGASLGDKTLLKTVNSLLPGSFLRIDLKSWSLGYSTYWAVKDSSNNGVSNNFPASKISELTDLISASVKRQMVSDVPIGIMLSGGVDSSAITCFASRHSNNPIKTFSVAFDFQKEISELDRAKKISDLCGTEHHELHISGGEIADVVEKMVFHHDSPFSDAANIPLYLTTQNIKNEVKVILQGDGGDELFGGYQRYNTLHNYKLLKIFSRFLKPVNNLLPSRALKYRVQRYLDCLAVGDRAELMALLLTVESKRHSPLNIFSEEYKEIIARFDPFERYRHVSEIFSEHSLIDAMLMTDMSIILPDIFLEKVDKSTMASSVEVRVPFLDNDIIDFSLSILAKDKIKKGKTKWLLKKSLEGVVPNEILYAKKQGFGVPYEYWIKTSLLPLLKDNISLFSRKYPGVLNVKYIDFMLDKHVSGVQDRGFMLWKLLNFTIWANNNKLEFGVK